MKIVHFAVYFAVSLALLMLTFRIDQYLRNSTLSKTITVASYIILAFLLSLIAVYLVPSVTCLILPKLLEGGWADAIMTAGIIFVLFCAISVLFGPVGVDLPGTRIRGIFFAEWKFVVFILKNGAPLALLGGILKLFAKQ